MTVQFWGRLTLALLFAAITIGCGGDKPKNKRAARDRDDDDEVATTKSGDKGGKKDDGAGAATGWATIKGRIVWGKAELPTVGDLEVTKDKDHCGTVKDNKLIVDPKTKGIKDVIVFLKKPKGIHPSYPKDAKAVAEADAKAFEEATKVKLDQKAIDKAIADKKLKVSEVRIGAIIDQPKCAYVPRTVGVREGQTIIMLNPAPVPHNVKVTSGTGKNNSNNNMLPETITLAKWSAETSEIDLECSIHGWMKGSGMCFDHPYFAVTKEDGSFELKNVPAGEVTVVVRKAPNFIDATTGEIAKSGQGVKLTLKADEVKDYGDIKYSGN